MSTWFSEQIHTRKLEDNEVMARAYVDMAGIVMGKKIQAVLNDELEQARSAMDMILKFYGIRIKEFPVELKDFDRELDRLLHPYGIMKRTVNLTKGWYKDAVGPMLGYIKETQTPVALMPDVKRGYYYFDASKGKNVSVNRETEKLLGVDALCFYKPFPLKKLNTGDLLKYLLETLSVNDIIQMAVLTGIATFIGMAMPRLTYWLYSDELLNSGSTSSLFAIGVFMASVSISTIIMNSLKNLLLTKIQRKNSLFTEAAAMMRVLSLPSDFFKQYSAGEISQRMTYITSLCNSLNSMVVSTGLTSVFSFAYITQIFRFAPGMVIPSLIIILVNIIFSCASSLIQMGISKERMENTAKESGMSYAMISGIQKIKLSGAEKRAFGKWSKTYSDMARLTYDPPMFIKINTVISTAIGLAGTLVMYFMALQNGLSVAEYTAFNSAYGMLFGALSSLFGIALEVAGIKPYLKMVEPIFDTVPEVSGNKDIVEKLGGGIEISHLSFKYGEDLPLILDDLSIKISPKQYVAIVGKTGCGKSTLLRLLIGFEVPVRGTIFYDGKDIKGLDLQSLRSNIGTVLQSGSLMNGSIYENIAISKPDLTLDEAWEAAEMAGIADDIREMPMGMHTVISEGGGGISGGQKQRLMIARAVAGKPKILMFDEATSALDNKTQKQVSEALDSLKCTRVIIAHRLSTIKNADRILVLDKGKIIEDGNYDELIAANGYFAELVSRQIYNANT